MYRVTPDVQALVQAAISGRGPAGALIASWERGEIAVITCEPIIAEFEGVLRRGRIMRKYAHITHETILARVAALRAGAVLVTLIDVPRVVSEDPDDDIVIACALAGNAEYIVSRDKHLLRLGSHQGIPIISTEVLSRMLRGQVSEPLELVYGPLR
ncbi:MAG: putative toxin-antitoxin system toxin component, PIN family [bacterium]